MRINGRRTSHPAKTLRNYCEFEGVVSSIYPALKETKWGNPYLSFCVDISTETTIIRVSVNAYGELAKALKFGPRVLVPGTCVLVTGQLGGYLTQVRGRARWITSVRAANVELLADGGFTGQVVGREAAADLPEPSDDEFPAEAF